MSSSLTFYITLSYCCQGSHGADVGLKFGPLSGIGGLRITDIVDACFAAADVPHLVALRSLWTTVNRLDALFGSREEFFEI